MMNVNFSDIVDLTKKKSPKEETLPKVKPLWSYFEKQNGKHKNDCGRSGYLVIMFSEVTD